MTVKATFWLRGSGKITFEADKVDVTVRPAGGSFHYDVQTTDGPIGLFIDPKEIRAFKVVDAGIRSTW